MPFYDDRVSTGKRRSAISATCPESEWKVACAKNGDRPPWYKHPTKVWLWQWLTIRIASVDHGLDPRTIANDLSEHAKLGAGACPFACEPRTWQCSFRLAPLQ